MSGCTDRCGHCGRCSEAWEQGPEPTAYAFCDLCGRDILHGAVSLAGLGVFCNRDCATAASLAHAASMEPRQKASA